MCLCFSTRRRALSYKDACPAPTCPYPPHGYSPTRHGWRTHRGLVYMAKYDDGKDGGSPAEAWLQLLVYMLCIFTLALVGALPTRDPRMDPIAHARGKRYVIGRICGMIKWNIHGSVQFEILSRAVHQPVVWMQRRSPSLLVDDEMNG